METITTTLASVRPGPFQHRELFSLEKMLELTESIKESGILNPPIVMAVNGHYELIAGERRWRAMTALELSRQKNLPLEKAVSMVCERVPDPTSVPVADIEVRLSREDDRAKLVTMSVVDNLQRVDLTIEEEANDIKMLLDMGHSRQKIAKLTGKSWPYVNGILTWLELEPEVQHYWKTGQIHKDWRVSEALKKVPTPELRLKLIKQFVLRRSPIKAIQKVCERSVTWGDDVLDKPKPAPAVPVQKVQVVVEESVDPSPKSSPCFCPACAMKIQELAEELCGDCRVQCLTPACLNCPGAIEVLNKLVALTEATYDK